ncbi:PorT family protein [Flavobacteriaceae bacterium]|nr:PorT family protein [Flavobacteriaceae bacterium]
MLNRFLFIGFLSFWFSASSQVVQDTLGFQLPVVKNGDYYREDQLYFNISSIRLTDAEGGLGQDGFSYAFALGFYRDIPLNQRGSIALAAGIGYDYSRYQLKYLLDPVGIDDFENVESATSQLHSLQIPIEIRFRTSTATKYSFWRVYTGFTFDYRIQDRLKFKTATDTYIYRNTDVFQRWGYGPHANVGYGIWNFYIYYNINNIFSDDLNEQNVYFVSQELKLGFQILIF